YAMCTTRLSVKNDSLENLDVVQVECKLENGTCKLQMHEVPGSEFEEPVDLLLLAMGFLGPERYSLEQLGVELDARGNVKAGRNKMTSVPGVVNAGDMSRGQPPIVCANAEGR